MSLIMNSLIGRNILPSSSTERRIGLSASTPSSTVQWTTGIRLMKKWSPIYRQSLRNQPSKDSYAAPNVRQPTTSGSQSQWSIFVEPNWRYPLRPLATGWRLANSERYRLERSHFVHWFMKQSTRLSIYKNIFILQKKAAQPSGDLRPVSISSLPTRLCYTDTLLRHLHVL